MKTEANIRRSAKARLKEASRRAVYIGVLIERIQNGFHPADMYGLRGEVERLLQAVHEYSAYHTALTDGEKQNEHIDNGRD